MGANVAWKVGDIVTVKHGMELVSHHKFANSQTGEKDTPATYKFKQMKWDGSNWIDAGMTNMMSMYNAKQKFKDKFYADVNSIPVDMDATSKEWGAADITVDDFIYEKGHPQAGEQRPLFEVAKILDPKLPGKTGEPLMQQIKDMAPKYQSIAKKEQEQKEFAGEAREKDIYGLSKEARKVGAKARSAYGGMGAGMRGAATAGADIAKGFEETQQAYKKDIYGIEQKAAGEFEGAISKFIDPTWLATDAGGKKQLSDWSSYEEQYADEQGLGEDENIPQGREGGYVYKDRSGIGNNRRKTFLDLMTSLPDAGGS